MTEPTSAAGLMSTTGWATVDYNRGKWIPCLASMPDGYERPDHGSSGPAAAVPSVDRSRTTLRGCCTW